MPVILFLAPLFVVFELWQLVISERYVGIKQIERNGDPRTLGLHEFTAFVWSMMIISYWAWMVALLFLRFGRVHGLCLQSLRERRSAWAARVRQLIPVFAPSVPSRSI